MTSEPTESPQSPYPVNGVGQARPGEEQAPVAAEGPSCPACGHRNRPQSQFCGACGAPLAGYCPYCGQVVAAGVVCCEQCALDHPSATVGKCQTCGFSNDLDAERCRQCGARLLTNCARCDAVIPGSFSYCPQCGFDCTREVVERVVGRFEVHKDKAGRSRPSLSVGTALMGALMVLSVALMLYILWQLWAM